MQSEGIGMILELSLLIAVCGCQGSSADLTNLSSITAVAHWEYDGDNAVSRLVACPSEMQKAARDANGSSK